MPYTGEMIEVVKLIGVFEARKYVLEPALMSGDYALYVKLSEVIGALNESIDRMAELERMVRS